MSRITGLATGLDVDTVVEETMQAERVKIDAVEQQKKLAELQQEMYRDVITECRNFYDDYFDILKSDSLFKDSNWSSTVFTSSNPAVTVTGDSTAEVGNYKVEVTQLATAATKTIDKTSLSSMNSININGVDIELSGEIEDKVKIIQDSINGSNDKLTAEQNEKLKSAGITAKYSQFSEGLVISTTKIGGNANLTIDGVTFPGENALATITDANGTVYAQKSFETNSVTIDGVKFEFNNVAKGADAAVITGKKDVSAVKDKIVKFVNDYNTLLEKLNKLVTEKRDSDYMPLTDDQKSAMSEKEIELWEAKVKQGQLSRDSDIKRIINGMKSAMSTMMGQMPDQFGLSSMGITLVNDYSGSKAGTLKIDEEKLDVALKNNMDKVKELFTKSTESGKEPSSIMYKMKVLFDKETQTSSGALLKKAGMEGTATASNNTLSLKIQAYNTKIARMETLFSTKQQALYSKYATLETLMNNLNSQMSSITSMFSS